MTPPNVYDIGDGVICEVTFRDEAGALADPTTVTFKSETPAGVELVEVYGSDVDVSRESVGVYRRVLTPTTYGRYTWRFEGLGVVIAAFEGVFRVRRSAF